MFFTRTIKDTHHLSFDVEIEGERYRFTITEKDNGDSIVRVGDWNGNCDAVSIPMDIFYELTPNDVETMRKGYKRYGKRP